MKPEEKALKFLSERKLPYRPKDLARYYDMSESSFRYALNSLLKQGLVQVRFIKPKDSKKSVLAYTLAG